MAVAESIIADKICSDIFRQYFVPVFSAAREGVEKILDQLYDISPHREAIFRLQLLAAYTPEDEQRCVTSIIESAAEKVAKLLDPLVFQPNTRGDFKPKLEGLLREAADLWKHIQRSAERGEADNNPGEDWAGYEEYDTAITLSVEQEAYVDDESEATTSLFPRVCIGDYQVCAGFALWSNQSTVVTAKLERIQLNRRNSTHARVAGGGAQGSSAQRGGGGGERRRSNESGSSAGVWRTEDPPMSPITPSRGQSSRGHTASRQRYSAARSRTYGAARGEELDGEYNSL
jgi:hypothetical protein